MWQLGHVRRVEVLIAPTIGHQAPPGNPVRGEAPAGAGASRGGWRAYFTFTASQAVFTVAYSAEVAP